MLVEEHAPCVAALLQRGSVIADLEVALNRLDRLAADRREAVFAALALHPKHAFLKVEVGHLQLHQLADADAAGVEDFEHRLVAGRQDVAVAGASSSFCTCSRSRHLGRRFSCLGVRMVVSGLALDMAAADEELVEAPQRRQLSGGRALGVVLAVKVREELADGQRLTFERLLIDLLGRELLGIGGGRCGRPISPPRYWPNCTRSAP